MAFTLNIVFVICIGIAVFNASVLTEKSQKLLQSYGSDASSNNTDNILKITVFYESLCPDSIDFFNDQVTPNWKIFFNRTIFDLVPYGNAKQTYNNGTWKFECQHGPQECYNNKLQACAIADLLPRRPKALLRFITCFMQSKDQNENGPMCAKKYNIVFKRLKRCADRPKYDALLAHYGNRTHSFQPLITWIPTIAFDGIYTSKDQDDASDDLKSVICRKLNGTKPSVCNTV